MGTRSSRVLVLAATAAITGSVLATGPATAQPSPVPDVPPVQWGQCDEDALKDVPAEQRNLFSCAKYQVPLDYANPGDGTVDIAMMRRAAAKPGQRIGSLFLNPGGPGGPGFRMPVKAGNRFDPDVLDKFDIVGFDPRGIDRSTRLRCFESDQQAKQVKSRMIDVPVTDEQIDGTLAAYKQQGKLCDKNAGKLLKHMATSDVVRDLDRLREGVGDEQLSFAGFSYGTLIGSTYANMFPDKTRAIIIDGNVDPRLRRKAATSTTRTSA